MIIRTKRTLLKYKWITLSLLVLLLVASGILMAYNKEKNIYKEINHNTITQSVYIEKEAENKLKEMSLYLNELKEFSFSAISHVEYVIDSNNLKIQINDISKTIVQRPDKIRVVRKKEDDEIDVYYDGKKMSVYGKNKNYYAEASAPSDIDQTLDYARDILNIEMPASDLLYTNSYKILQEDVISGMYLGKAIAGGVVCHHLAFRGNTTDWQLWIESGDKPLPRKYVITSKKLSRAPQYSIEIMTWETSPQINKKMFSLIAPKEATKVEFIKNNTAQANANKP